MLPNLEELGTVLVTVCVFLKKQKITDRRKADMKIKKSNTQGRKCPLVAANVLQTEGESV